MPMRRTLLAVFLLAQSVGSSGCMFLLTERTSQAQHQAVLSFFSDLLSPTHCCRHAERCCDCEGEREAAAPARVAPVLGPQTASPVSVDSRGKLSTRVAYPGGYLQVLAKPARSTTQVVLSLRAAARLSPAPCGATLFRDGERLAVRELVRASDHEVLIALDAEALRDVDESLRFGGEVCGHDFTLDSVGRETLSLFEARFREQIAARSEPVLSAANDD